MIISSDEIPFAPKEGEGSWTTLQEQIKSTYNLDKFDDEDYYDIANKFELPIHIAFLIIKSLQKDEFLDINDLASASYYSICRDVLIPYKNKAYVFRRYFGLKYPYLKNTDTRLEWFLRQKNGLSLSQKVSLLEQESSYASIGIGKVRFEQALQRINLLVSHEEVEKRRLIEFNGEWALAVTSFIEKERGDLTAAEFLKVGDALQTETKHKLKQNIIGYLLSRMGKIEIYFLATQIRKFHDLISRTSSLIRAFSNVFEHDVKMIERLTSMHSMVDLAHLVENNKSLVDYERLLPFRSFRPMLAAKWAKQYQFPAAVEAKFDGIRLLVHKLGNRVQAYSRRRKNYTNKFPSITNLKDLIPAFSIILDG
ncbi:MAG: hypothetical protein IH840_02070 [Candidatus Heimdallarchaeota archaeon]|nr:hypothetical protein [Candidatus Heimdallarchaeota archaeon]